MRAAFYRRQGDPAAVLELGELPTPDPAPGQVRVRVHASAVNPSDTKGRSGYGAVPMPFPLIIPHQDGAGVIDAVGPGVDPSRIGERVWIFEAQRGRAGGTAAEFTVVPARQAVPLPDGVDFDVGACLGIPAMTAHRCLFADGSIQGRSVLVTGGAGAVGLAAILLARWAGAHVITTVSRAAQADIARAAGAHLVINRREDDVAARVLAAVPDGVDRIVDVALVENFPTDLRVIAPNGTLTSYAVDGADDVLSVPAIRAMRHGLVIRWVFVYGMPEQAHRDAARDINACLVAGAYRPVIAERMPLGDIVRAHATQERGGLIGKQILQPG